MNQDIAGAPTDIHIHLNRINVNPASSLFDAKAILINDCIWKGSVLAAWEARLSTCDIGRKREAKCTKIEVYQIILLHHLAQSFLMLGTAVTLASSLLLLKTCGLIFAVISTLYTIGCVC